MHCTFTLSTTIPLGTPCEFILTGRIEPEVARSLKPETFCTNAFVEGSIRWKELRVGDKPVALPPIDAGDWSCETRDPTKRFKADASHLPRIRPGVEVTLTGEYSGEVPTGFPVGYAYTLCLCLQGTDAPFMSPLARARRRQARLQRSASTRPRTRRKGARSSRTSTS